jgi:SAM-dependent methyltransferase
MEQGNYQDLVGVVHPRDDMFTGSYERYHVAGMSAVSNIADALALNGRDWASVTSCLDFPSGYGRVLRHLVRLIPPERITACDIMKDAVDFCVRQFGAHGFYSNEDLSKVRIEGRYDLIWVGSLVTHFPFEKSIDLLNLLGNALTDNGILVFSVVGAHCLDRLLGSEGYAASLLSNREHQNKDKIAREYLRDGFAFVPYKGAESYGLPFLSLDGVRQLIRVAGVPALRLIGYREAGWNHDHDVYTVARRDSSRLLEVAPTTACQPDDGRQITLMPVV